MIAVEFIGNRENFNLNAAQLTVNSVSTEKGSVVEAVGEVDLTTVQTLRETVLQSVKNPVNVAVIVDLTRVDFIDSAGLALLVEARKELSQSSRTLHILLAQGRQPERVLRLGRFDTIMNLAYDISDIPSVAA